MIYNSVDLTRVAPNAKLGTEFRMRFGIPADRKIVLQVSWIIPEKGIPDLLEAARLVVQQNDKVHFVLVGEGAFRQQYTEDAKRMGLEGHITWAGLIADPFGEGVYDAADIVCQVSNWEEVFGWVIAEAMAYMKPVIGTRVGGIPELVLDGETGFLVERSDSAAIADRIVRLATDEALRERMGHAARKITEEKFNLRKNVAQLVECYGLGNDR
jgi:glycosyltransferase involved in cell wall biosynthesis